jgi:hypothetical protein
VGDSVTEASFQGDVEQTMFQLQQLTFPNGLLGRFMLWVSADHCWDLSVGGRKGW